MNTCAKPDRIYDAECCYEQGKFCMGRLPSCLPKLFTLRFTAPAEYNAGDVLVVDKQEYPVFTSQMEAAGAGIFKAGAVMLCEIDRDRDIAFIRTGSAAGTDSNVNFQSSGLTYYIDPQGDDSPNNPGGQDSPFKTLAAAGRAAWQSIVMNPLGTLTFSFNPGTYELTEAERVFMTSATHPLGLTFRGTTSEKPLLIADHFICTGGGVRRFENMQVKATSSATPHTINAQYCSGLYLINMEIIAGRPNCYLTFCNSCSFIRIMGELKLNGNGHPILSAFCLCNGHFDLADASVIVDSLPSVSDAFARCVGGFMYLRHATVTGTTSGRRYQVLANAVINTYSNNTNLFPGTAAGTTASGGQYL